jgi:hypothetical protein
MSKQQGARQRRLLGNLRGRPAEPSANPKLDGFGKKHGKNGKAGPPVHDVWSGVTSLPTRLNRLWLSDITEDLTPKRASYICAQSTMRSPTASSATRLTRG